MADFAQVQDVKDVMPPFNAKQTAAAPGLIAQASTLIRGWGADRGINIDAHIANDPLRAEIVKVATVNAVKRSLGNLDGLLETTVVIDDFRETHRRDSAVSTGQLYIADSDLVGLVQKKGKRFRTLPMRAAL